MNFRSLPAEYCSESSGLPLPCGSRKKCSNPSACPLNKLGIGCHGYVVGVSGDVEVRRRLLEMGFCNGAEVEVIRRAPFGDPIEFCLRGYHLSLRNEQAMLVQILPS